MNITTKFSIGERVYRISRFQAQTTIVCSVCNDTKQVVLSGQSFKCPNCERGTSTWHERWFAYSTSTTIGEIKVEVTLKEPHPCDMIDEDEIPFDGGTTKEVYMLAATGIGSGTLWNHSDLFLSLEEAQIEVSRRNDILIKEESERLS